MIFLQLMIEEEVPRPRLSALRHDPALNTSVGSKTRDNYFNFLFEALKMRNRERRLVLQSGIVFSMDISIEQSSSPCCWSLQNSKAAQIILITPRRL